MVFVDRQSRYPNRWTLKKSDGSSEVVTLIRNDEPVVEGTPMNAETLNELSTVAGALNAKEAAAASAAAALASQNAAKTSETNVYNSAFAANNSATAAAASKEAAASSEASVAANASAASESASVAAASQKAAKTSETNSKSSETNAKASENAAKTSEKNAFFSASSASTSEKNASESEKNASASASSAIASATSASNSASQAAASAKRAETIVSADKTLTISGAPADAKTVGDALGERYTKSETYAKTETYTKDEVDAQLDNQVQSVQLSGRTLTITFGDGSTKNYTTQDTTDLTSMTGTLPVAHGGTGKSTALTAEDVGAVETGSAGYVKSVSVSGNTMTITRGDGTSQSEQLAESYTLPAATAETLGGVKVGAELDIAADGTISAESLKEELTETIAASVAAKSEARRVWDNYVSVAKKWTTATIEIPANVDYLDVACELNLCTTNFTIAKGSSTKVYMKFSESSNGNWFDVSFVDGALTITYTTTYSYAAGITLTGYHYPTLAELLAETQTAQEDTDALLVDQEYRLTLLELGVEE